MKSKSYELINETFINYEREKKSILPVIESIDLKSLNQTNKLSINKLFDSTKDITHLPLNQLLCLVTGVRILIWCLRFALSFPDRWLNTKVVCVKCLPKFQILIKPFDLSAYFLKLRSKLKLEKEHKSFSSQLVAS